ncbi:MAG: DUF2975 domain-containing protein [Chloroflexi bacterium]|nr:DUF2975 domain-containing protein [Chloroflexota bacterium]
MIKLASRLLRVALVVLLLGTVFVQVLVPVQATMVGTAIPEVEYLVVPYSVAAILFIVCVQVALLVVWRLLSLVDGGVIFTRRALRWVDVIIGCAVVATVLCTGPLIHLLAVHGGGPGIVLGLAAFLAGGLAFVLHMIVMRGLRESANADRTELDEVI